MEKFQNQLQTIEFNSAKELIIQTWTKETADINADDFKKEMLELARFFKEYQPRNVLINMSDFFFIVTPDLQEWVQKNVNSILENMQDTKTAYLVSPDLFAAVSVEQTIEESGEKVFNHKFFKNIDEAYKWLS